MQLFFSFGIFMVSEDSLRHFEISFETPFALHLRSYV